MMDKKELNVYRHWDDGFVVREMRKGEEQQVIKWCGLQEAMPNDLQLVMDLIKDCANVCNFYAGELKGEMVASLVLTSIADDLKYIGAMHVDEQHRGLGFARRLIDTAHENWNGTIVLDAYQHLVPMYEKFGYKSTYKTTTYEGSVSSNATQDTAGTDVREVSEADFDKLVSYDDRCYIQPGCSWRHELISRWLKTPGGRAMIAVDEQSDVVGYGCRRPAITVDKHHFIGPLYAESFNVAWDLVQQLTSDVSGQTVIMTVIEPNLEALRLVHEMKLQETVPMMRMYRNRQPKSISHRVFACDTFCGF